MRKAIVGAKIVLVDRILEDHAVVFDEKIRKIIPNDQLEDETIIQASGYLCPGFIDVHIHGAGGSDVMDATPEALMKVSQTITKGGTTSFLATTMTMHEDKIAAAFKNVREVMKTKESGDGASILGVHVEGPFISPKHVGAQDPQYLQKPNDRWISDYYDIIKMITMAPEEDENYQMIKKWSKMGIVCSMGHTDASYDQVKEAYQAGISHVTHCFNAMTGLHHRNPGAVGAAFILPLTIDLITDMVHVHRDLFEPVVRIKGKDKVVLITDAIRVTYLDAKESELGGQKAYFIDGGFRLASGSLAGSVHTLDQALRNMMANTHCTLVDVSNMLSKNPAKLIGVDHYKGQIAVDYDADLVLLGEDLTIRKVFVMGREQSHEGSC